MSDTSRHAKLEIVAIAAALLLRLTRPSAGVDGDALALWLGNSQAHGINQYEQGHETGPPPNA